MKIYKDESITEEVVELDFGRVEVGEEKIVSYWLYNDSTAVIEQININLEKITSQEEVEILEYPKELRPFAKAEIKAKWSPSLKIKAGLKVKVKVSGLQVWG
jgi:hypothetical protein